MGSIKCHILFICYFKIKFLSHNFTINKQNIMKKSKYQHYLYCFIVCIVVPHEIWFSYQQNIIYIVTSAAFRGVRWGEGGGVLIRGRRLFQCGHPKMWSLLEGGAYLRSGVYQRRDSIRIRFKVNCKFTRIRLIDVRYIHNIYLLFLTWNMHSSSSLVLY